jgi:hypothetical protein
MNLGIRALNEKILINAREKCDLMKYGANKAKYHPTIFTQYFADLCL